MFSREMLEVRPVGWRARLTHPAAYRWYPGAMIGLLYQVSVLIALWNSSGTVGEKLGTTALLAVVYVAFLVLPPLLWWESERRRYIGVGLYFALTLTLFPVIGVVACWTWVYVACAVGMVIARTPIALTIIGSLGALQLIVFTVVGTVEDDWFIALVTVSIGVMMSAFARQLDALRRLRNAQGEIARLAVIEERARFSRDMHDVLGHSLTVVTVKSELARRLIPTDPDRAVEEIADIERLSRSALADLRAAVAGYREMSLSTELAAAQAGLAAADIQAHLPRNGEEVEPELRELFGWVLREGVTNVIRHSGSRNCWVTVGPESLDIEDDGRGPQGSAQEPAPVGADVSRVADGGSGLAGLSARAALVGARIAVGAGPRGGTLLSVRRAT
ncbi:sensor histidine kinase [Leifsonia sp. 21MFCrub1.1]|uniref:sensor histidine kinase n=1 Tax=Leifsonia sp. 21MFCrub1.1 TaxID=1798223 RepID=UPI000B800255|nr:histidine kinase [Leifsonia sp. 21MFCrub1.1]